MKESRKKTIGGKLMSVVLGVVVAASLCPSTALANNLTAASMSTKSVASQPVKSVAKASKKKTVWVVTGETRVYGGVTQKVKYSYNKSGLTTKVVRKGGSNPGTVKYSYKGGVVSKIASKKVSAKFTVKKGRVVKGSGKANGGTYSESYAYDKKGRVSRVNVNATSSAGRAYEMTTDMTYDKAGRCIAASSPGRNSYEYAYDSKGNLVLQQDPYVWDDGSKIIWYRYRNTYDKGGRLSKSDRTAVDSDSESMLTRQFTYKKIKVSKSAYKKALAQQWEVLNGFVGCYNGSGTPPTKLMLGGYNLR